MQIILENPNDIAAHSLEPILQNQLTDTLEYQHYLPICKKVFLSMLRDHPDMELRPYQYEYAALVLARPNHILGYEQGVGKTNISICAVLGMFGGRVHTLKPGKIQVSVPTLLAAQRWVEDGSRFGEWAAHYQIINSQKDLVSDKPIWIYTHDFCKRKVNSKIAADLLASKKPIFLIVDEIHALGNRSQRTAALRIVRNSARRCVGLSGTLSDGNLQPIYTTAEFVYGSDWPFGDSKSFMQAFGQKEKLATNYLHGSQGVNEDSPIRYFQRLRPEALSKYYELMSCFIHRTTLDDPPIAAYAKKPTTTVELHSLKPNSALQQAYTQYIQQHRQQIQQLQTIQSHSVLHRTQALNLIYPLIRMCNYEYALDKWELVKSICEQASGKVIVFCNYVDSARGVYEYLTKHLLDREVIRVYASDNQANPKTLARAKAIDLIYRFQHDPKVQVGVFSSRLASEAIDLTTASAVIHFCPPWSSKIIEQGNSRAVRPGNKHPLVTIHWCFHKGMIGEHQVGLACTKLKNSLAIRDYSIYTTTTNTENDDLSPYELAKQLLA